MNFKKILPIILIFIAAIGALLLSINSNKKIKMIEDNSQAKTQETNEKTNTNMVENFTKKASIMELLSGKQSLRCTFSKVDGNTRIDGTMYTDGTNVRTNTNTTVNTDVVTSNTIMNSSFVYIWQSSQPKGMKMDLEKFKEQSTDNMNSPVEKDKSTETANVDEQLDFDCNKWTPTLDMFVVPQGIEFVDITQAMNQIQQTPCSVCDTMTDETRKAQCKQILKCN